jgi:hypothetical protein
MQKSAEIRPFNLQVNKCIWISDIGMLYILILYILVRAEVELSCNDHV